MIKKVSISVIIGMTILLITLLIISGCKAKKKSKSLSLIKAYNYVICDEEREIKIIIYHTEDNCFNQKELIENIGFSNKKGDKKLALGINKINKTKYVHEYLGEKYYSYEYYLSIPVISNEFVINEGYLTVSSNGNEAKYDIGSIHLLYYQDLGKSTYITINSLLGQAKDEPYQTLDYFDITIENKTFSNARIIDVWIDRDVKLTSSESEDTIIGYMQNNYRFYFTYEKDKIIDTSFIVIDYVINNEKHRYVIDTFCFYENGYALPSSNEMIQVHSND